MKNFGQLIISASRAEDLGSNTERRSRIRPETNFPDGAFFYHYTIEIFMNSCSFSGFMTDYFGIGNAMTERVIRDGDYWLERVSILGLKRNKSNLIKIEDYDLIKALLISEGYISRPYIGGSCSNIIAGLASRGYDTHFFGGVGSDYNGDEIAKDFEEFGVETHLVEKGKHSAKIFTFVTDDNRTYAAYLGAARDIHKSDIVEQDIIDAENVIVTGYKIVDSFETSKEVMRIGRESGAGIVVDEACGKHVEEGKHLIIKALDVAKYGPIDLLVANEEETEAWMMAEGTDIPAGSPQNMYEGVLEQFRPYADIFVQKLGPRGAMAISENQRVYVPAYFVENVENTNGAGDGFLVGFIDGFRQTGDLEKALMIGNYFASQVILRESARMSYANIDLDKIRPPKGF